MKYQARSLIISLVEILFLMDLFLILFDRHLICIILEIIYSNSIILTYHIPYELNINKLVCRKQKGSHSSIDYILAQDLKNLFNSTNRQSHFPT